MLACYLLTCYLVIYYLLACYGVTCYLVTGYLLICYVVTCSLRTCCFLACSVFPLPSNLLPCNLLQSNLPPCNLLLLTCYLVTCYLLTCYLVTCYLVTAGDGHGLLRLQRVWVERQLTVRKTSLAFLNRQLVADMVFCPWFGMRLVVGAWLICVVWLVRPRCLVQPIVDMCFAPDAKHVSKPEYEGYKRIFKYNLMLYLFFRRWGLPLDPTVLLRAGHFVGLGWMFSKRVYTEKLRPYFQASCKPETQVRARPCPAPSCRTL